MSIEASPDRSAKLFVRADSEPGIERSRQRIVDRLSALQRAGVLDEYEIVVWGRELRLSGLLEGTDYYESTLEHIESFEEWASRNGTSLDPLFERDRVESVITDESYDRIVLPVVCLALYQGDELDGVYPCRNADGLCSIAEYLDRVEPEDTPQTTGESIPS